MDTPKNKKNVPRERKTNTSWGAVANWYDTLVEKPGSYQQEVILPNVLRLAGNVAKLRWLDVGCGQGFFCRALASAGAVVTGTDISSEMIAVAKRTGGVRSITYVVASAEDLSFTEPHGYDRASMILSLQNIEQVDKAIESIAHALVPLGRAYIVLNHPAFRVPKVSSWGFDDEAGVQYRRIDAYMSESRATIDMHPGVPGSAHTASFHRPLQYFFKLFAKHRFAVTRLEEWISNKRSERGPRQRAEDIARKEFPLFLALEIEKR